MLIALLGCVFSPWYARARRRGAAEPLDHATLNVALYGAGGKRWAFTERPRASVRRAADHLAVGPSALTWDGRTLEVRIDEWTAPVPSRIRGVVRVMPEALIADAYALDGAGCHRWWPIAPCARVEVALERPALRWTGRAYLDSNRGDAPLEDTFSRWDWSRSELRDGATAVLYDVHERGGREGSLALRFDRDGGVRPFPAPTRVALPAGRWGVARTTRAEGPARVTQTLEDTPFYVRSTIAGRLLGEAATGVHESLSLDRFRRRWVQALLPFRAPRAIR